mgnify:CR=1 FL=1
MLLTLVATLVHIFSNDLLNGYEQAPLPVLYWLLLLPFFAGENSGIHLAKEAQDNRVALRRRFKGDLGTQLLDDVVTELKTEIETRRNTYRTN